MRCKLEEKQRMKHWNQRKSHYADLVLYLSWRTGSCKSFSYFLPTPPPKQNWVSFKIPADFSPQKTEWLLFNFSSIFCLSGKYSSKHFVSFQQKLFGLSRDLFTNILSKKQHFHILIQMPLFIEKIFWQNTLVQFITPPTLPHFWKWLCLLQEASHPNPPSTSTLSRGWHLPAALS